MPIAGVNAATETTYENLYSARLNSIAVIEASRQLGLTIRCAAGNKCFRYDTSYRQANCKSWNGAACNSGKTTNATEQYDELTLEGICPSQTKNAGDALSILVSAAKYGQTK